MKKIKEISLLVSLALHMAVFSSVLYFSVGRDEPAQKSRGNIAIKVVSVAEFDAQTSDVPTPVTEIVKLPKSQNVPAPAKKSFEFHFVSESDLDLAKVYNLEVLDIPKKGGKTFQEFTGGERSFTKGLMKRIESHEELVSQITVEPEKDMFFVESPFHPSLAQKSERVKLSNNLYTEKQSPSHNKKAVGSQFKLTNFDQVLDEHPIATVARYDVKKLGSKDFEFNELLTWDSQLSIPKSGQLAANFLKSSIDHLLESTASLKKLSKDIEAPTNSPLKPLIKEEKIDLSSVSRSPEHAFSDNISTTLVNFSSDADLNTLRESLVRTPGEKEKSSMPVFEEVLKEPISSSWGSAIEKKVLSNLVYPQKARNRFLEGRVSLKLEVFSDGTLLEVVVRRSSGHLILDKAAKAAVLRSLKFPAAPDYYPNKKFIFNLPVKFSS